MPTAAESPEPKKLILYRGFRDSACYTWSPFVTKVEFHLRVAGVPYTVESGSPISAPKGKIPYVDLSPLIKDAEPVDEGGSKLGDSTLIVKRLVEMGALDDLNGGLSAEERMLDMAIGALCEDRLYFFNTRERWIDNYYAQRDKVFESKPFPIRFLLGNLAYRKAVQTAHLQGAGRHSKEERRMLMNEIWTTINDLLEERRRGRERGAKKGKPHANEDGNREPFFVLGGQEPTNADATLFGFVLSGLIVKSAPETKEVMKGLSAVLDYADRIHDRWFPDYEKWEL